MWYVPRHARFVCSQTAHRLLACIPLRPVREGPRRHLTDTKTKVIRVFQTLPPQESLALANNNGGKAAIGSSGDGLPPSPHPNLLSCGRLVPNELRPFVVS